MNSKKVRGIKRKCESMIKRINLLTEHFPAEEPDYWYIYLPAARSFIDSPKTPRSVKRLCIQTLINRVQHLIDIKPQLKVQTRVIAAIDLRNLWQSQIIIFFGEQSYKRFFNRNSMYHKWIPIPNRRGFKKEWRLNIPRGLRIQGYKDIIIDVDVNYVGEMWFVGELEKVKNDGKEKLVSGRAGSAKLIPFEVDSAINVSDGIEDAKKNYSELSTARDGRTNSEKSKVVGFIRPKSS